MSIIAAIVSSSGRRRVGPKHTPKLDTVIKFLSDLAATLQKGKHIDEFQFVVSKDLVVEDDHLLFQMVNQNIEHFEMTFGKPVD